MSTRLLKFLISGGTAALVEFSVFLALMAVYGQQWLLFNQSLSFASGFGVSFFMNRAWVFRSGGAVGTELSRYAVLALINLVASNAALSLLINVMHLPAPIGKFLVMGLVAAWNYLIFSRLIFKTASPQTGPH